MKKILIIASFIVSNIFMSCSYDYKETSGSPNVPANYFLDYILNYNITSNDTKKLLIRITDFDDEFLFYKNNNQIFLNKEFGYYLVEVGLNDEIRIISNNNRFDKIYHVKLILYDNNGYNLLKHQDSNFINILYVYN